MLDPHGAVWTVRVGFTSTRPVRPDQHTTHVHVEAPTETEAHALAAQIVGTNGSAWPAAGRPPVEMVTSTRIVACTV